MAPLPSNNTGRLFVDYGANGHEHTVLFRYGGAGNPTVTFQDNLDNFLALMNPFMPTDWTFLGARVSPAGSNVSVPFAFVPTPFDGAVQMQAGEAPAFLSFVGRSGTGRRGRIYFLGCGISPANELGAHADYRLTGGESQSVAALLTQANVCDFLAVDGNEVIWNQYVNLGYHAYWQKRVRG
jgi:hypothetical protein